MNLTASRAAGDVPGVYVGPGASAGIERWLSAGLIAEKKRFTSHRRRRRAWIPRRAGAGTGPRRRRGRRLSLHPARRVLSVRNAPSPATTSSLVTAAHVVHIALDGSETHPHG